MSAESLLRGAPAHSSPLVLAAAAERRVIRTDLGIDFNLHCSYIVGMTELRFEWDPRKAVQAAAWYLVRRSRDGVCRRLCGVDQ